MTLFFESNKTSFVEEKFAVSVHQKMNQIK